MKNLSIIVVMAVLMMSGCKKDKTTDSYTQETVNLGSGSASDVYFSFANGEVKTTNRADWDIAFSVNVQSATILINEGAGDELYCVGDTNAWSTFNTFDPGDYKLLLNNNSDWSIGAFNADSPGGYIVDNHGNISFGWGIYDMTAHNVVGDSIYVIKPVSGPYKKLFIRERNGMTSEYTLRWADIDGSNQVDTTISIANYITTKNFIHFSLVNKQIVEAEPDLSDWDLLFTRYLVVLPSGTGSYITHMVTGVLSNPGVTVAKVSGIPPRTATTADATGNYVSDADAIGYDWKDENLITDATTLVDSLSYFVKSVDGNTYQLYFSNYGGVNSGTVTFKTKLVE